jgi:protocatechuate 3,4-dioxygenase, beta subunit
MRLLLTIFMLAATAALGSGNSSIAVMAGTTEPGTRLIVHGQVFDPSGKKPVAGVTVYAYHTDATGRYNKPGAREPRLRAWVTTDAQGRFELRTIRPVGYPGRRDPAHIHFELRGGGYPKQWVDALEFANDPRMTPERLAESQAKGKFGGIVTTTRDARGVEHATIHIRLGNASNF